MTIVASNSLTLSKVNDGVGVTSTVITYANSTSGTTAPTTGWTSSIPSPVKGQYLWTKTVWTSTDTSTKTAYSVSYNSKDGTNGSDGTSGIIVSSVAPTSPQNGQLWQDTSTTPQLVKKWTGSSWVIWELYVENMNVNNLSALSPNLGNITGGSYTSWKYIDMYNTNGDTAMAGIYINAGVMRSLLVINSNTQDPDVPNALTLARLEGSQTAFGSTTYYIDNAPIYTQYTLNETLKNSPFWSGNQESDVNSIAGSIVGGKDIDSTSSIFISAQNAYISRWGTDSSVVDVNMLESISSYKQVYKGKYSARNNGDATQLSLGNLSAAKYLSVDLIVYGKSLNVKFEISNEYSNFNTKWKYSAHVVIPEFSLLSNNIAMMWKLEILCTGAVSNSLLRWGTMWYYRGDKQTWIAAENAHADNAYIVNIRAEY